ncbi:hypothetical protein DL98DRAFT_534516 [Cadophora sp. DSE1049]|nr:hypothetical protein DL98DRAFT_534516 [Cadophora sp. DSE1049]
MRSLPPKQVAKTTTVKPVVSKQKPKTICIALLLTDRDIQKLGKDSDALVEGTARRSGCMIHILPKQEGDTEREMLFAGSPVAVAKAKTWIKERLATKGSQLDHR